MPDTGIEIRDSIGKIGEINDKDHTFALRVVSYGVPDSYGSVWEPGVFDESLRTRLPSSAWAHNQERIIGSLKEYDLRDDGVDGLVQFADFDAVPDAKMAWSLIKDGHISDTSFAFKRQDWTDKRSDSTYAPTLTGEKERLRRARLDEVSPVLVGAVPGSRVLSVRSEGRITRMDAGQILVQVATGQMTLRDALNALEDDDNERADAKKPHKFVPDVKDKAKCLVCGGMVGDTLHENDPAMRSDQELSQADAEVALSLMALDEGLRSAGTVKDPKATERLMEYWSHGKGAAKIVWGTDGDFKRCEVNLGKYVPPNEVAGLCSNLHVRATGARPGHAPGEKK